MTNIHHPADLAADGLWRLRFNARAALGLAVGWALKLLRVPLTGAEAPIMAMSHHAPVIIVTAHQQEQSCKRK